MLRSTLISLPSFALLPRVYTLTATFHRSFSSHFHFLSFPTPTYFCPQTSTSRSPSWVPGVDMLMSKHVTIMTRALHRFTQNSSSSVACVKASRYSGDSLSKFWSTSTVGMRKAGSSYIVCYQSLFVILLSKEVTYTLLSTCWGPSSVGPSCLPAPPITLDALPSLPSLAVAFSQASSAYC